MTDTKVRTQTKTGSQQQFDINSQDVQQFLEMAKATGATFDVSSEEGQNNLRIEYNRWVASGRPKPEMPKLAEAPIPLKLYRLRYLGKQKMYWQDTKGKFHGKEFEDQFRTEQLKDAQTGQVIEQKIKTGTVTHYTIDFTKEDGEKLVDECLMKAHNPAFFFIVGNDTYSVTSKDFTADFDEIIQKIRTRQYTAI